MGFALEMLDSREREVIARNILIGVDEQKSTLEAVSSHCPWNHETTPGGAFFYHVDEDVGYCHSCARTTDLVGIYNLIKGNDLGDSEGMRQFIKDYCDGRKIERKSKQSSPASGRFNRMDHLKKEQRAPQTWSEHALKFVESCHEELLKRPEVIEQLWNWGINEQTICERKIGWNPNKQWRPVSSWGLPYEEKDNGKERCIMFPVGIVFPCWNGNEVCRMQIRTEEEDMKYYQIKGGGTGPVVIGNPESKIWMPIETIRDGELAYQELKQYDVAILVLGGVTNRPTQEQHKLLMNTDLIMVALDADRAGAMNSYHFEPWNNRRFAWINEYPNAIRWPVPKQCGKDLGELAGTPLSVEKWFLAGLPDHVKKKISIKAAALEREKSEKAIEAPPVTEKTLKQELPTRIVKELPPPDRVNLDIYNTFHHYASPRNAKLYLENGQLGIQWQPNEDEKMIGWGKRAIAGQPTMVKKLTEYMEAA